METTSPMGYTFSKLPRFCAHAGKAARRNATRMHKEGVKICLVRGVKVGPLSNTEKARHRPGTAFTSSLYTYIKFHIAVLFATKYDAIMPTTLEISLSKNKPPRSPHVTKAVERQRISEQRIRNFDQAAIVVFGLLALVCLSTYHN